MEKSANQHKTSSPSSSADSGTTSKASSSQKSGSKDCTPTHPTASFISPALLPNQNALLAVMLSTIRFDLLMSFNEAKLDHMCVSDPIHHFVWCMDACIRTKKIDRRHASELAYHLNRHRKRTASIVVPKDQKSVKESILPANEVGLDQDTSCDWVPDEGDDQKLTARRDKDCVDSSKLSTRSTSQRNVEKKRTLSTGDEIEEDLVPVHKKARVVSEALASTSDAQAVPTNFER